MITVVGEALIDLVGRPGGRTFACRPGGSPANVAVGLGRLGNKVALATRIGDDALGRILRDHLTGSGVELLPLPGRETSTNLAIATLDPSGGAVYDFRLAWDADSPPQLPPHCRAVHTGSLATTLQPGAAVVEAFLAAEQRRGEVTLSLDPNVRPALLPSAERARDLVERQVALVDLVKASTEDLEFLYPGHSVEAVARRWLATGPALVVITRGGDGAYAATGTAEGQRAAVPVDVVDTVGAGDAFASGLLDWLGRNDLLGGDRRAELERLDRPALEDMLAEAVVTAGLTCARLGADPPSRAEVDKMLRAAGRLGAPAEAVPRLDPWFP